MKKVVFLLLMVGFLLNLVSLAVAEPIVYDNSIGDYYETVDPYKTIASVTPGEYQFEHNFYFTWGIEDITPSPELDSIRIVFDGIANSPSHPNDILNIYLFDNVDPDGEDISGIPVPLGFVQKNDSQDLLVPDWETKYNATWIDAWTDPTDDLGMKYDVVFEITDPTLIDFISNGNSFVIGMDPDCLYSVDEIRVEAPVPEPATMLLLGSGLVGLVGIGRKKYFKKG